MGYMRLTSITSEVKRGQTNLDMLKLMEGVIFQRCTINPKLPSDLNFRGPHDLRQGLTSDMTFEVRSANNFNISMQRVVPIQFVGYEVYQHSVGRASAVLSCVISRLSVSVPLTELSKSHFIARAQTRAKSIKIMT